MVRTLALLTKGILDCKQHDQQCSPHKGPTGLCEPLL
jgi:hypothetical protein